MVGEFVRPAELTWEQHSTLAGVVLSYLLRDDRNDKGITCALVRLPAGAQPERHIHEDADDIVYVLEGKGVMWVNGAGDLPLAPGTFLRVPKGVLHQPHGIEEDLVLLDIWSRNGRLCRH